MRSTQRRATVASSHAHLRRVGWPASLAESHQPLDRSDVLSRRLRLRQRDTAEDSCGWAPLDASQGRDQTTKNQAHCAPTRCGNSAPATAHLVVHHMGNFGHLDALPRSAFVDADARGTDRPRRTAWCDQQGQKSWSMMGAVRGFLHKCASAHNPGCKQTPQEQPRATVGAQADSQIHVGLVSLHVLLGLPTSRDCNVTINHR